MGYELVKRLPSILKYPGGKNRELEIILKNLPSEISNYYEPFVGGGAVFFALDCNQYFINDKSTELMNVYKNVKSSNKEFLRFLEDFNHNWKVMTNVIENHSEELILIYGKYKNDIYNGKVLKTTIVEFVEQNAEEFNGMLEPTFNVRIKNFINELERCIVQKMIRMKKIESQRGDLNNGDLLKNIEVSFKSAFYMHFRYLYNIKEELVQNGEISEGYASALFVFIRQYCYSSMFRFNRNGDFNVPYGGISYNRKTLERNIDIYKSKQVINHLNKTTLSNEDFYDFIQEYIPEEGDFVFLDPPYDTEFSTYDKNSFDQNDQARLAKYLIDECRANFMIVIKYTEFIAGLYPRDMDTANGKKIYVSTFEKKYAVSFQDRNDRNVTHMIITNYPTFLENLK